MADNTKEIAVGEVGLIRSCLGQCEFCIWCRHWIKVRRERLRPNVLLVCRLAQAERNTARKSSWSPWHTRFTRRMLAPRRPRCYPLWCKCGGQNAGSAWRRVRAENPALSFLLRLPPKSLAARCSHQQPELTARRAQRVLLQGVCVRRFLHVHQRGCFASRGRHRSPKILWSRTPSATRRTWNPWSTWGGKTTEHGPRTLPTGHATFNSANSSWRRRAHWSWWLRWHLARREQEEHLLPTWPLRRLRFVDREQTGIGRPAKGVLRKGIVGGSRPVHMYQPPLAPVHHVPPPAGASTCPAGASSRRGEEKYWSETSIAKFWRQTWENRNRCSGQESEGIRWCWKRKRYLLPVERKWAVLEGRPM